MSNLAAYELFSQQFDRLTHENPDNLPKLDNMPDRGTIEAEARLCASTARMISSSDRADAPDVEGALRHLCMIKGVDWPKSRFGIGPTIKRLQDDKWWLRRLVVKGKRAWEAGKIAAGDVNKNRSLYCTDWAVLQWRAMRRRNAEFMQETFVFNDDGWLASLASIAEHSLANPAVRRAEMMTRLKGFEEFAQDQGDAATFLTITCPSRFHANSARYDGSTPKQAQDYLCKVWARIRAKLNREQVPFYGFRVAEPHNDGCPHWHAIIFAHPGHLFRIEAVVQQYASEADAWELKTAKAKRARFHRERIKLRRGESGYKGGAVAYVAKYISKNIDGRREDGTSMGEVKDRDGEVVASDAIVTAERVLAWSSLWGIRQFQQVGGLTIGPYRELRRVHQAITASAVLELIRQAADVAGDQGYVHYMKAAMGCPTLGTMKRCKFKDLYDAGDKEGAINALNRYGEPVTDVIGVMGDGAEVITRRDDWRCMTESAIHAFYDEASEEGGAVEFWADICEAVNMIRAERLQDKQAGQGTPEQEAAAFQQRKAAGIQRFKDLYGPAEGGPLDLCQ